MIAQPQTQLVFANSASSALLAACDQSTHFASTPDAGEADVRWFEQPLEQLPNLEPNSKFLIAGLPFPIQPQRLKNLAQDPTTFYGIAPLRCGKAIQWLKQMLDTKQFGDLVLVEWNIFLANKRQAKPLEQAMYPYLDLQQWLFGEIEGLKGEFRYKAHAASERSGILSFGLPKSGMGLLSYCNSVWNADMECSLTVMGKHASLKLSGENLDRVAYYQGTPKLSLDPATTIEEETLAAIAAHQNNKPSTIFTLRDAKRTAGLIERIYALRNEQHVRKTA